MKHRTMNTGYSETSGVDEGVGDGEFGEGEGDGVGVGCGATVTVTVAVAMFPDDLEQLFLPCKFPN